VLAVAKLCLCFSALASANAFSYSLLELNSIRICIFHRLCPKGTSIFILLKVLVITALRLPFGILLDCNIIYLVSLP